MRRGRRFFGRRHRRAVTWLPGFSCFDPAAGTSSRLFGFAGPIAGTTNTWGVAVQMVTSGDLTLHGGEDAVLTRVRGRLYFMNGRKNSGAGLAPFSFALRAVLAMHSQIPAGTFGEEFTSSAGIGSDAILWTGETIVSSGNLIDSVNALGADQFHFLDVDVKAKRRITEDSVPTFFFQTILAGATGADMRITGGLRTLLMRPK